MASAMDSRITTSFPIAGSQPCDFPIDATHQPADYEQNCVGRPALHACNYTCQYLLGSLEPDRYQLQISHEYDNCCFHTHELHSRVKRYEANVRAELVARERVGRKHGWFTAVADNHTKHEVCAQDKTLITAALRANLAPGAAGWQRLPCDIIHQPLPANCAADVEPGLPGYEGTRPPPSL